MLGEENIGLDAKTTPVALIFQGLIDKAKR